MESNWAWLAFNLFVIFMLVLDLGLFHRKSHEVKIKEALIWSGVWIALSLLFNLGVYHYLGKAKALEFLTGYLLEKSLSVDNIFVFVLIFRYFAVPAAYQHKVLFWGIFGALVMRVIFIFGGIALLEKFHWLIYVLGALLIFTGIRMARKKEEAMTGENKIVSWLRRKFKVTNDFHGDKFTVKIDGKRHLTPLFLVVVVVEITDLIFAVDSIPAILAISKDSFIVYTSNVFAILGLRSLYFALSGAEAMFRYLKYGLALILVFVGVKMCISPFYKIPIGISLSVIGSVLLVSILLSMVRAKDDVAVGVNSK